MPSAVVELVVPSRFCGPPTSGNGGWSAGALAALLPRPDGDRDGWPPVEVTLRQPPPLDAAMVVTPSDDGIVASFGGSVVLSARPAPEADPAPIEPVPADLARAAEATYPGLVTHPFGTCFSCGPDREPGDGLRIFPGVVDPQDGLQRVAATWVPHESLADTAHAPTYDGADGPPRAALPVTWAALDCAGAWSADVGERMMVLGRMTAAVDALPVIGEEHVVLGLHHRTEGRKSFTTTTILDADERVVARAEQVWISIDPPQPGQE
ncbi:hypothetical protein [Nocardioides sp. AE5]|uniref:hypothetical protein n=1 Tax=Nocardioides sp. AE5 TaxID=2962573 RepID=UPI0028827F00|nr:hypothetical protein [Nocardioides sp. AE5]MDT0203121.1 hypothetical protein [Nocardioides sp. AE5]